MSKNLPSIAELLKQDQLIEQQQAQVQSPNLEIVAKPESKPTISKKKPAKAKLKEKVEEKVQPQTKGSRRSFSLPLDVEEKFILALAQRRIAKKPYQVNDIIEEAVVNWLENNA